MSTERILFARPVSDLEQKIIVCADDALHGSLGSRATRPGVDRNGAENDSTEHDPLIHRVEVQQVEATGPGASSPCD